MTCKGKCKTYKFIGNAIGSKYAQGGKFCSNCGDNDKHGIFLSYEGMFCPCCGMRLRYRPCKNVYREKLLISQQVIKVGIRTIGRSK